MKKFIVYAGIGLLVSLTSCVSKKKYVALEDKYETSQNELYERNAENEEMKGKLDEIQSQVDNYYAKINSLQEDNSTLSEENETNLGLEDGVAVSKRARKSMREVLKNVDSDELAKAETLRDSMDLAISYNLKEALGESDDIDINVDRSIVEITISDKLLFASSSYRVNPESDDLLERIAKVAKSEPAMEVLVEGHTDDRTFVEGSYIEDNWDLSLRRAASVVRILQDKFDVDGKQLIASGRSSYSPVADNDSQEGMQRNRRTRIIILPNLDKFLALLGDQ